jgi:hypothetical protein
VNTTNSSSESDPTCATAVLAMGEARVDAEGGNLDAPLSQVSDPKKNNVQPRANQSCLTHVGTEGID